MAADEKVLWAVNFPSLNWFIERAREVRATAVAIRTDNNFTHALPAFHDLGIKVYGWRWPKATRDRALAQAHQVVALMHEGLDGFIADPEADRDRASDFWDKEELAGLAEEFCSTIRSQFPDRLFGTTSHYKGRGAFPNLPWHVFFRHSQKYYPQAYWRMVTEDKQGRRRTTEIGRGVSENYVESIRDWRDTGAPEEKIVPMAGEIEVSTADEVRTYVRTAESRGITELHFYTADTHVSPEVWRVIAEA